MIHRERRERLAGDDIDRIPGQVTRSRTGRSMGKGTGIRCRPSSKVTIRTGSKLFRCLRVTLSKSGPLTPDSLSNFWIFFEPMRRFEAMSGLQPGTNGGGIWSVPNGFTSLSVSTFQRKAIFSGWEPKLPGRRVWQINPTGGAADGRNFRQYSRGFEAPGKVRPAVAYPLLNATRNEMCWVNRVGIPGGTGVL
jgi:hypothetical protein